jgi:hypothetical protein
MACVLRPLHISLINSYCHSWLRFAAWNGGWVNDDRVKIPCKYEYILNFLSCQDICSSNPKPQLVGSSTGISLTGSNTNTWAVFIEACSCLEPSLAISKHTLHAQCEPLLGAPLCLDTISTAPQHTRYSSCFLGILHLYIYYWQLFGSTTYWYDLDCSKATLETQRTSTSLRPIIHHYLETQLVNTISAAP